MILEELLPEAFAVVKETARRFSANTELVSTATELDRELSIKKEYIRLKATKSIYKNTWTAAAEKLPGTWCIMMCS